MFACLQGCKPSSVWLFSVAIRCHTSAFLLMGITVYRLLQLSNSMAIHCHQSAFLLMGITCLPGNVPTLIACMLQGRTCWQPLPQKLCMAVIVAGMLWQLVRILCRDAAVKRSRTGASGKLGSAVTGQPLLQNWFRE